MGPSASPAPHAVRAPGAVRPVRDLMFCHLRTRGSYRSLDGLGLHALLTVIQVVGSLLVNRRDVLALLRPLFGGTVIALALTLSVDLTLLRTYGRPPGLYAPCLAKPSGSGAVLLRTLFLGIVSTYTPLSSFRYTFLPVLWFSM